jgi:hypothetical protein
MVLLITKNLKYQIRGSSQWLFINMFHQTTENSVQSVIEIKEDTDRAPW